MENAGVTIRIIDYTGDFDTLNEVNLIGPYPNYEAASEAVDILANLPGVDGSMEFEIGNLMNNDLIDPAKAAEATNCEEISELTF